MEKGLTVPDFAGYRKKSYPFAWIWTTLSCPAAVRWQQLFSSCLNLIDLCSQVDREGLELEQLLDSTTFDPAASMERFKKLQETHKALATERFQFLLHVRSLLGLDRFQLLKAQVWKYRMKQKHGRRHPGEATRRAK